jgi:hypothetical protein
MTLAGQSYHLGGMDKGLLEFYEQPHPLNVRPECSRSRVVESHLP